MKPSFKIPIIIWLIILTIISLAALCRSFYTTPALQPDYLGILVGLLAALATTLIGWQIFTLIDLRNINAKFEREQQARQHDILKIQVQLYKTASIITTQLATHDDPQNLMEQHRFYQILLISTYSRLGAFDICNKHINNVLPTADVPMTLQDKNLYTGIIYKVDNQDKIELYPQLVEWILNMQVRNDAQTPPS